MKRFNSMLASLAVLTVCASVFASEDPNNNISFSNKFGSDVVKIENDAREFTGMYNKITTDITSERIDAGIDATIRMSTDHDGYPESFDFSRDDFDWYITFTPIDVLCRIRSGVCTRQYRIGWCSRS